MFEYPPPPPPIGGGKFGVPVGRGLKDITWANCREIIELHVMMSLFMPIFGHVCRPLLKCYVAVQK